jgi:hypothetical protein
MFYSLLTLSMLITLLVSQRLMSSLKVVASLKAFDISVTVLVSQNLIFPYVLEAASGSSIQAVHAIWKLESVSTSGVADGRKEGASDGSKLIDGIAVGSMLTDGLVDGRLEGLADGSKLIEGIAEGVPDGLEDGCKKEE